MKFESGNEIQKCSGCNTFVCDTCKIESEINKNDSMCLPCYLVASLFPYENGMEEENTNEAEGEETPQTENDVENNPQQRRQSTSIIEMRKKLEEEGYELDVTALANEV